MNELIPIINPGGFTSPAPKNPQRHPDFAKQRGIDQSAESAGRMWAKEAIVFIMDYLESNATMFVDDIWEAGLPIPTSKRALGSVIQYLARNGHIEELECKDDEGNICLGAKPSIASNGQLKRVWKSNLYLTPKKYADCDCAHPIRLGFGHCTDCFDDVTICSGCNTIIKGCNCGYCAEGKIFRESD